MSTATNPGTNHCPEGLNSGRTVSGGRDDRIDKQKPFLLSRRHFCLCCISGAGYAATNGWLTPSQAFAEARGLVTLFKDSAAVSPIVTHKLRNNIAALEGSGGNIAVLTGPDGKVLIDAGID